MSEPTVTCSLCGRQKTVTPDGRGFPPDIAKRRLQKECAAAGCACDPVYRAGIGQGFQVLRDEWGTDEETGLPVRTIHEAPSS